MEGLVELRHFQVFFSPFVLYTSRALIGMLLFITYIFLSL